MLAGPLRVLWSCLAVGGGDEGAPLGVKCGHRAEAG